MKLVHLSMADALRALLLKRKWETVDMLESCGVDPRTVPLWPDMWREGPVIHVDQFMYNEHGVPRRDDRGWMLGEISIQPERIPDWIPFE